MVTTELKREIKFIETNNNEKNVLKSIGSNRIHQKHVN